MVGEETTIKNVQSIYNPMLGIYGKVTDDEVS